VWVWELDVENMARLVVIELVGIEQSRWYSSSSKQP